MNCYMSTEFERLFRNTFNLIEVNLLITYYMPDSVWAIEHTKMNKFKGQCSQHIFEQKMTPKGRKLKSTAQSHSTSSWESREEGLAALIPNALLLL